MNEKFIEENIFSSNEIILFSKLLFNEREKSFRHLDIKIILNIKHILEKH